MGLSDIALGGDRAGAERLSPSVACDLLTEQVLRSASWSDPSATGAIGSEKMDPLSESKKSGLRAMLDWSLGMPTESPSPQGNVRTRAVEAMQAIASANAPEEVALIVADVTGEKGEGYG